MKAHLIILAVLLLSLALSGGLLYIVRTHFAPLKLLPLTNLSLLQIDAAQTAPYIDLPVIDGETSALGSQPSLRSFTAQVTNGRSKDLVGVYAPGVFALPVMQQPEGEPSFVSTDEDVITQFSLPRRYGSTGLLAHNFLSGSQFFDLKPNEEFMLVYGTGRTTRYRVSSIQRYQALDPLSPFSDFIDLSDPDGSTLTSAQLFSRIYTTSGNVVFQTCIDTNGDPSWGRIFIIAKPVQDLSLHLPEPELYVN